MQTSFSASDAGPSESRAMRLVALVAARNPMHKAFVERAVANLELEDRSYLEKFLEYCEWRNLSIEYIAECYLSVVREMLIEQLYFKRHKKYRYSNYIEVADSVYDNHEYMDKYMYGLVVTAFFWPNHVRMARFFASVFRATGRANTSKSDPDTATT